MDSSDSQPATVATTDIDRAGDLIVEVEGERFRVSSKALSLASPVFAAMLQPGVWKEGQHPQPTPDNPSTISLPEDNARTVKILFQTMHFQIYQIERLTLQDFKTLARAYDKYECLGAMSPIAQRLLQYRAEALPVHDLGEWLWVAYHLNAPVSFSEFSREYLLAVASSLELELPEHRDSSKFEIAVLSRSTKNGMAAEIATDNGR